jgi:hypothetical protein
MSSQRTSETNKHETQGRIKMEKTNKEKAEILVLMRRLWDTAESFALAIGMDETEAAKFAARQLDYIVEQSKGETK